MRLKLRTRAEAGDVANVQAAEVRSQYAYDSGSEWCENHDNVEVSPDIALQALNLLPDEIRERLLDQLSARGAVEFTFVIIPTEHPEQCDGATDHLWE